jgi:hypothetical protein
MNSSLVSFSSPKYLNLKLGRVKHEPEFVDAQKLIGSEAMLTGDTATKRFGNSA